MTLDELMNEFTAIVTMKASAVPGSPVYFSVKNELDRMHAFAVWSWNARIVHAREPDDKLFALVVKVDEMLKKDLVRLTKVYLTLVEKTYAS